MIGQLFKTVTATVICLVFIVGPVTAQDVVEEPVEINNSDSSRGNSPEKRAARLEEYKNRAAERVSEAKARQIKNRCVAAQAKITALQASDNALIEARIAIYQRVVDKVSEIVAKAQAAGLDTLEIESTLENLQEQATPLIESLRTYGGILTDLAEMDCESDPEAFQAALSLAREARSALKQQAKEFKTTVKNDLKPGLQDLRQQLDDDEGEETDNEE